MKLTPFHDNIFIKRDELEERKTKGGLHLPKSAQKQPDTAVVLSVGPGRTLPDGTVVKPTVKPGDRILISRYAGVDVNWDIETRTVIPWSDVLGLVEEDDVQKTSTAGSRTGDYITG
ncbi:MAG: co-chaperone GroES [Anaerolineaceae bacterium]|nr:co-chaperone GroES [Anaerolineaceae bacterium]